MLKNEYGSLSLLIGAGLALVLMLAATLPASAATPEWRQYLDAFVQDGRSNDPENGYTHSEGQAYTLILAFKEGDRDTFDAVWGWTRRNMMRDDGLISWKWRDGKVADANNATDADMIIAWALIEAGRAWNPAYLEEGLKLLSAIERRLLVRSGEDLLILPGADGFVRKDGHLINLSYWVWPAIDAFRDAGDRRAWNAVAETGTRLLGAAGKGAWGLVPDWTIHPSMEPRKGGARASYDAMRVPLYLVWSGRYHEQAANWKRFWTESGRAWVDLRTGELAEYGLQPEHYAVMNLVRRAGGERSLSREDIPVTGRSATYYSSVVIMLTKTAWTELFLR